MAMIGGGVRLYISQVRHFGRNARLFLLHLALSGAALGVYALLYNFYILSLGYDAALLGRLLAVHSTATLIVALPAGIVSDRLGRKRSLLIAGLLSALAVAGMALWPATSVLYALSALLGAAQSLGAVTLPPFLMENSSGAERTYLFSGAFTLQMVTGMVGFWLGGRLPGWIGAADVALAYRRIMLLVAAASCLSLAPLFLLRAPARPAAAGARPRRSLRLATLSPVQAGRFLAPVLITALGAGLFVPFMNLFFRQRHQIGDATIGSLFAAGSLVMGIGFMLGPPLADRYGKIRVVILTQLLFMPALALLGFAPWAWLSVAAYLVRVALMTMDDPLYQAFVMERVGEADRGTVASLLTISTSLGWAAGPAVSGWLQVKYGFTPIFLLVIGLYAVAVAFTWRFFGKATGPVVLPDAAPAG